MSAILGRLSERRSMIGVAAVVCIATAPFLGSAAVAQELVFNPEVIVGSPDHYEKVKMQLQVANVIVMDYLRDGTKAVESGHRVGLANFESWYRSFRSNKEDATEEMAKKILKNVLTRGLEIVFPEDTPFIEALKVVAEKGYDLAVENLHATEGGNIDDFLAQLRVSEETYIKGLLDTPDQFRQQHADAFEAAQWEIVNEWMDGHGSPTDRTIPPSAVEILSAVGVPQPGSATATRIAESVLISHIAPVYKNTPSVVQGAGPYSLDTMATVAALVQMDVQGNKQRICNIERRSFNSMYWYFPWGECDIDKDIR